MPTAPKPAFLGYLHSFRGFAIINIVAVHAFAFVGFISTNSFKPTSPFAITNELLFHNSTIYFAVISGMLFTAVLKQKGFKAFFISKFKYVLLPYIFFTLAYSLFDNNSNEWFALQPNVQAFLKELPRNFIYGKASFVFWYMPVLFFLYLVTPVLDYIMNIQKWGNIFMLAVTALPLVVRRVELDELMTGDFLSLQTMIHFTGAYAGGMFIAGQLDQRIGWIQKNKWLFIGIALLSTAVLLYVTMHSINRISFLSVQSSLYYMQKMAISGLALLYFKQLADAQPRWLDPIAKSAFTIYFAHVTFLGVAMMLLMPFFQNQKMTTLYLVLGGLLFLIISITLSIVFAWIFRKIFGRYSRMIVGS